MHHSFILIYGLQSYVNGANKKREVKGRGKRNPTTTKEER